MGITANMREEVTVILEQDDSVKDGFAEYYESGFDESKLKLEGEPTRWRLQRLSYDQRKHVHDMTSLAERREAIVRFALMSVTGYKMARTADTAGDAPPVEHEDSSLYKRTIVKLDWLRTSGLPTAIMVELAGAAMLLSEGSIPFPAA